VSEPSRGGSRDSDGFGRAEHFRDILGRTESKLLPVEIADGWIGFHDDSRLGTVNAGRPRSLQADG
jgi:hypothetical protein